MHKLEQIPFKREDFMSKGSTAASPWRWTFVMGMASILALVACTPVRAQYRYPFQNPTLPVDQRIDNVLSLMTLQEKIDFLGKPLNLPRLGIHCTDTIPSINGSNGQFEGLHGLAVGGPGRWGRRAPGAATGPYPGDSSIPTTQFPQAAGLGETWDPALLEKAAAEEGREARYIYQSFDRGGLIIRAPNADLARDPRWGRAEESYGEDPYLVGTMAVAFVKGLQGDGHDQDGRYWQSAALVKHFMANSNEDNRRSSSSDFDARLLHEYYAAPFRMAIEEGKANALMASYNAVNGVPMTANPLLRTLVMQQWGLNGILDTDREAMTDIVTKHHFFATLPEAAAGAIHAGINQFLDQYEEPVKQALAQGLITQQDIDNNLRGVFRVLFRLGLLDPPQMVPYTSIKTGNVQPPWDEASSKALALQATHESIVLLKNEHDFLPLNRSKIHSIAVLGPNANVVYSDGYGGMPPFATTPLQGIQTKAGGEIEVRTSDDPQAAVELARKSDVAIVVVGNKPYCAVHWGSCAEPSDGMEAVDRKSIDLPPDQEKLIENVYAANPRTIVVLVSSFPFAIDWAEAHVPAIVTMTHSSEVEGTALADALFGDYDPGGKLGMTWPASLSQLPPMMDYNIRDGRTYMYFKDKPLYPFGYGLSYTRFSFSPLQVSSKRLNATKPITISTQVTNIGSQPGDEVVQLYVQHIDSKVSRPREELKGFERVSLKPGEARRVFFQLPARAVAYWNEQDKKWTVEADQIRVMVGSSSADIREKALVNVAP